MTQNISTNRVGLAAFMKINGASFLGKNSSGVYLFESEQQSREWRLAYAKTNYPAFNAEVVELLNLEKGSQ